MPSEVIKIIGVGIIAFFLGTTFIEGRQGLEVASLNQKISSLEKKLSEKDKQLIAAQSKAQKQHQMIEEFYKQWKQEKN